MKRKRNTTEEERPSKRQKGESPDGQIPDELSFDIPEYLVEPADSEPDEDDEEREDVNKDEERVQRNMDYLEKIKSMISGFAKSDDPKEKKEMEADEDGRDLLLEQVKRDIMERKNLVLKQVDPGLGERNFQNKVDFWSGHRRAITAATITSDDTAIYSVAKDQCLIRWDLSTRKKTVIKNVSKKELLCVCVSHDSRLVCCGGKDHKIRVFDTRRDKVIRTLEDHKDWVTCVQFCGKSHDLYSGSYDSTIKYWNADEEILFKTLHGHVSRIHACDSLIFDDTTVLSASADCSIRLWDVPRMKQFIFNGGHAFPIDCVQRLHKDRFLSGSQDGTILLWSTSKRTPMDGFRKAHGGEWISSLRAHSYSDMFLSGSCDGYVRIWRTGQSYEEMEEEEEEEEEEEVDDVFGMDVEEFGELDGINTKGQPKKKKKKKKKGGREERKEVAEQIELVNEFAVRGWVNAICLSSKAEFAVASSSKEHRLGRWKVVKNVGNGLNIVKLKEE